MKFTATTIGTSFLVLIISAVGCDSQTAQSTFDIEPPVQASTDSTQATMSPDPAIAQEAITIPLHFEKKMGSDSHGFLPLYEYGDDAKVMHEGKPLDIVAPSLDPNGKVAYGFVYFTGQPKGALQREILFLIERYDGATPRFFVDLNNNLDLTDDAPAVEPEADSGNFLITLKAAELKQTHTVRLSFFRNDPMVKKHPEILRHIAVIQKGYTARMGGVPTPTGNWFADQTLNIRSASVRVGERSFQIGVYDENCNGSFADLGGDLVLIGEFEGEFLPKSRSDGASPLGEETLIQVDDQTFEILEVDPDGGFIRIVPSDKPYTRLKNGSLLPKFELVMLSGESLSLESLIETEKFLLIDFWGHWCGGCIQALPELKRAADELGDKLTILSLHRGDHDEARKIIENEGLHWLQAKSSEALVEAFLVDSWPSYILVDGEGRVRKLGIQLREALEIVRGSNPR